MFRNREDAAGQLAQKLREYNIQQGIILAVPRGAVPMGAYLAQVLGFPLDIVLTKKIGHPNNPEFAIGAVSAHGNVIINFPGISQNYVEQETQRIQHLLQQRYQQYVGNRQPVDLTNKTVIIVDDGIATGNTMRATIKLVKENRPKRIIVAIPVAPPEVIAGLAAEADDIICLQTPADFAAVSQFYLDFPQVSDQEVIRLLQQSWKVK